MKTKRGFTLIELLVIISIISLLSSITLTFVQSARNKARVAKTKAEMVQFGKAVNLLYADTERLPGGCAIGQGNPIPYVNLTSDRFGISTEQPTPELGLFGCHWGEAASRWKGPYYPLVNGAIRYTDAWGNALFYVNNINLFNRFYADKDCDPNFNSPINTVGNWLVSVGFDQAINCNDVIVQINP